MEKLHELVGTASSLVILGIIGLVLIWLILKAVKQGGTNKKPLENKAEAAMETRQPTSASGHSSPAQTAKTAANSAVGSVKPAVAIQPDSKPGLPTGIPEDSILHRHYLSEQAAKKAALSNPIPTDSILRRHYEAMQHPGAVTNPSPNPSPKKSNSIEQAIQKEASAVAAQPVLTKPAQLAVEQGHSYKQVILPEDSVLKRHILSQLQHDIRSGLGAKPTDSVLGRHYDQLIDQELQKRLAKSIGQ